MTSESFWPEMKDSPWIFQYDNTLNPDMTARIFANRIEHLRELIMVKKVFGHVTSFISVTEFQKRGLPHVHMLITLADKVYFLDRTHFTSLTPCNSKYIDCKPRRS
jgi:Helitron helicase-like domain at N-terminus